MIERDDGAILSYGCTMMPRLETLEDLAVYVNAEAERRAHKIMAERGIRVPSGTDEFECALFGIMRSRPVSAETISAMTGVPVCRVLQRLRKLEKYKLVEVATKREVMYWAVPRGRKTYEKLVANV